VADHPLRPATDRRLGGPLPHQLANPTSAAPTARGPCESPAFLLRAYAVLIRLSPSYPPLKDTFRCITHPFAARRQGCPRAAARLACVKHSASVQSEPGSNSSVQSSFLCPPPCLAGPAHSLKVILGKTNYLRVSTSFTYSFDFVRRLVLRVFFKTPKPGDDPPTSRKRSTVTKHPHASAV
jgi:hypothetical protein